MSAHTSQEAAPVVDHAPAAGATEGAAASTMLGGASTALGPARLQRKLAQRRAGGPSATGSPNESGPDDDDHDREQDSEVDKVIAEAKAHPEENLQPWLHRLTVRGIARVIDTLKGDPATKDECAKTIATAKAIKSEKERKAALVPTPVKGEPKKWKNDQKKRWSGGMEGEKNGTMSHFQAASGADAYQHVKDEEGAAKKANAKTGVAKMVNLETTFKSFSDEKERHWGKKEGKFGEVGGAGGSGEIVGPQVKAVGAASFGATPDGLNANAKGSLRATAVSTKGELHSMPLDFSIMGERFKANASLDGEAFAGAELSGNAELVLSPKSAGVEVGVKGFVGLKAEGGVKVTLDWIKKPGAEYAKDVAPHAAKFLERWIPSSIAHRVPAEALPKLLEGVLPAVFGSESGDVLVLGMTAKGSAQLGLGAEANASFSFKGGVIKCSGKASVTLGLGLGGSIDVAIGAIDGMRCLAVLAAKGGDHIGDEWKPNPSVDEWLQRKGPEAVAAIKAYCDRYANDTSHSWTVRQIVGEVRSVLPG